MKAFGDWNNHLQISTLQNDNDIKYNQKFMVNGCIARLLANSSDFGWKERKKIQDTKTMLDTLTVRLCFYRTTDLLNLLWLFGSNQRISTTFVAIVKISSYIRLIPGHFGYWMNIMSVMKSSKLIGELQADWDEIASGVEWIFISASPAMLLALRSRS